MLPFFLQNEIYSQLWQKQMIPVAANYEAKVPHPVSGVRIRVRNTACN
jgi:hypothetical protein